MNANKIIKYKKNGLLKLMIRPIDDDDDIIDDDSIQNTCHVQTTEETSLEDDQLRQDEELCTECEDEKNEFVKWKVMFAIGFILVLVLFVAM